MSKSKPIISISDLTVQRGGAVVLEGVNLDIHAGDFVGLSGPNGSGKSTLLMTIVGELEPVSGHVEVFGEKPGAKASRGRIAWVSQAAAQLPSNLKISVRELVALGTMSWIDMLLPFRRTNRAQRVEEAIHLVGLQDVANRNVQQLSGGQRQRAVVARDRLPGAVRGAIAGGLGHAAQLFAALVGRVHRPRRGELPHADRRRVPCPNGHRTRDLGGLRGQEGIGWKLGQSFGRS